MKKRFSAVPGKQYELETEQQEIPEPLANPSQTPTPIWQKLMPLLMIGVMLLMMYIMTQMGGRNPMMMMMPLMMLPMMLMGMITGRGSASNESISDDDREDYKRQLDEERKVIQARGETMHNLLQQMFPGYSLMLSNIGKPNTVVPMWTVDSTSGSGFSEEIGPEQVSYSPYLSPRVGTSVVPIVPAVKKPDMQIPEKLEPVTGRALGNFMRTQPYVANAPVGISLDRERQLARSAGVSIDGPEDSRLGLARAMLCSLSFNHSPDTLRIAVISSRADDWDWVKWLPHAGHPAEGDAAGPNRMIYETFPEFVEAMQEVEFTEETVPYFVVFVDCPDMAVKNPMPGVKRMSYVVVSAGEDYIATDKANRYYLDDKGALTRKGEDMEIRADYVGVAEALWFARKVGAYGTGLDTIEDVEAEAYDADGAIASHNVVIPPWNEVVGVPDIDQFNPLERWQETVLTMEIDIPVGYPVDENTDMAISSEPVILNVADSASNGSGPHGLIAGTTGTGKSFTTKALLVAAAAKYSPDKVSFICIDYKGGATFFGFEKLPHTIATISNLENERDLLDRSLEAINGILDKRKTLYAQYKVADLAEYRKLLRRGELPPEAKPVPNILVCFDEFVEFITANPGYKDKIDQIARIGRTLGVHLMLISQDLDRSTVGDAMNQMTYGISLKMRTPQGSRAVIDSDKATSLPAGKGDAFLLKQNPTRSLTRFRGYNIEETYSKNTATSTTLSDDVDHGETIGSDIVGYSRKRVAGGAVKISSAVDLWEELIFKDEAVLQEQERKAEENRKRKDSTSVTVYEAVMEAISRYNDPTKYPHSPRYWTPPLSIPITYDTSFVDFAEPVRLMANVGDLDDPYHHVKLPFNVDLSGVASQTFIAGNSGSGLTTALMALVSSLNVRYRQGYVHTILMDFAGAALLNMQNLPNVIGACTATEIDKVKRYLGEVNRVMVYREKMMGEMRANTIEEYFENRTAEQYALDPYGHIVIALDNFNRAFEAAKEEADDFTGYPEWWAMLERTNSRGQQTGVHFVATLPKEPGYQSVKNFKSMYGIYLHGGVDIYPDALQSMDPQLKYAFKQTAQSVPGDQPGRLVDPSSRMAGRIRIPAGYTPQPYDYDESGAGIYTQEYDIDSVVEYNEGIRNAVSSQQYTPPVIATIDGAIGLPQLLSHVLNLESTGGFGDDKLGPRDIRLPYGVSVSNVEPMCLTTGESFLAFGSKDSGKRTLIRDFVYSLYATADPERVRVVVLDANGELHEDIQVLKEKGLLAGYADNRGDAEKIARGISDIIQKRVKLSSELNMTYEEKTRREWYGENDNNPYDLYFIVNGLQMFAQTPGSYSSDGGAIQSIINTIGQYGRADLGFTFIGVGTDQCAESILGGSVYNNLASTGADVHAIRLSGSGGQAKNIGRFKNLPPGRGYQYISGIATEFQAAFVASWSEAEKTAE